MSPDPNLTAELNALFDVEPPLRGTPEQVLAAARGRRRQRIAVAGSAIGTVVLVGATAAAARPACRRVRLWTGPRTATAGGPHRRRAASPGSWCRRPAGCGRAPRPW